MIKQVPLKEMIYKFEFVPQAIVAMPVTEIVKQFGGTWRKAATISMSIQEQRRGLTGPIRSRSCITAVTLKIPRPSTCLLTFVTRGRLPTSSVASRPSSSCRARR